jgi:putative FmdB family regulatory protein
MPIYEYACDACGHRFEEWQKMSDPPVRVCPKCKSKKVEKLISQTTFALKGGGWYSDLYAGKKPGGDSKSDSSESSSSGGGEAKSDAKGSESKSESKSTGDKPTKSKKAKSGAA